MSQNEIDARIELAAAAYYSKNDALWIYTINLDEQVGYFRAGLLREIYELGKRDASKREAVE